MIGYLKVLEIRPRLQIPRDEGDCTVPTSQNNKVEKLLRLRTVLVLDHMTRERYFDE